jgi:[acyl-carrier-protein] S-malonyltransferase
MAAGHSLGEFSAYVAAGTIEFADAVRTVRRRGELMLNSGRARPGTMAALLGLDDAAAEAVCRDASTASEVVVPANFNAPGRSSSPATWPRWSVPGSSRVVRAPSG